MYTWYKPSSNGISFIIVAISTGVSTRKESKQSDQRLENLSSEQKQVHCNGYESLITISGEKRLNQDIIKLINISILVKCHFFWRGSIIHHLRNSTVQELPGLCTAFSLDTEISVMHSSRITSAARNNEAWRLGSLWNKYYWFVADKQELFWGLKSLFSSLCKLC